MDESNYSEAKYCDINMGNAKVTEACSKSKTDSISIQLTNKSNQQINCTVKKLDYTLCVKILYKKKIVYNFKFPA